MTKNIFSLTDDGHNMDCWLSSLSLSVHPVIAVLLALHAKMNSKSDGTIKICVKILLPILKIIAII